MKKSIITISVLALITLLITYMSPIVNAHSGKTDSSGGHTNSSTGEYHYHHGYPAHDHYDLDGDGDIDCPYDFEDKTDYSSNSDQSSNEDSKAKKESILEWGGIIAVGLYIFFMFVLPFILS